MIPEFDAALREEFEARGVLILRRFYDPVTEVEPIQRAIYRIIGFVLEQHGVACDRAPFTPETFDSGYRELVAADRKLGGIVYDAVKSIPAFHRLVSSERNEALYSFLRQTADAGIGGSSYGIRIDVTFEERFRSHWHQEYLWQPQSLDGAVFWSPLARVEADMGPVQICVGSHKDGLGYYRANAYESTKVGAYQIGLDDEAGTIARYEITAPLMAPGDLIVLDYLTLHQSGFNRATRPRWSMQMRYFNYQ